jgi:hypothetical protein
MNPMADDEIKIIRRVRHEISAECGHDVDRVVAYYRRVEEELRRSGRFRFAACASRREPSDAPEHAVGAETNG